MVEVKQPVSLPVALFVFAFIIIGLFFYIASFAGMAAIGAWFLVPLGLGFLIATPIILLTRYTQRKKPQENNTVRHKGVITWILVLILILVVVRVYLSVKSIGEAYR